MSNSDLCWLYPLFNVVSPKGAVFFFFCGYKVTFFLIFLVLSGRLLVLLGRLWSSRAGFDPLGQALLLVRKTVEKQQLVVVHIEVEPGVSFRVFIVKNEVKLSRSSLVPMFGLIESISLRNPEDICSPNKTALV